MNVPLPRRLATMLLEAAVSVAPHNALDWGHAMLSELRHVEGNWSALLWSFGGAGVLAKQALVAMIFPSAGRSTIPSGGDLFSKEAGMRKAAVALIASCVVASLLFFLLPVFRQAFQVSLAQWHDILHVQRQSFTAQSDDVLKDLLRKAERNRDAEAIAFVATRTRDRSESARLADEAVRLNANLTWVYAAAGTYYLRSPDAHCVSALEQWDPQNALAHLIVAERIDLDQVEREKVPDDVYQEPTAWREAMAAAFASPRLDVYVDRQKQLDRQVLARYQIRDPFQAASYEGSWFGLPSYASADASRYAKLLLEEGKSFEARGDRRGAAAKYWELAHFGEIAGPSRGFFMNGELKEAYGRLAEFAEMEGNKAEGAFYASLAAEVDKNWERQLASWRKSYGGSDASQWNAFLVRLSGLLLIFFSSLLALCVIGVLIRRRSLKLISLGPSKLTLTLASISALGALVASTVLFVSYWPYSHALQRFVRAGDESGLSELCNFLGNSQLPLGSGLRVGSWYVGSTNAVFYIWSGVTGLCALAAVLAVVRHLQTRHRTAMSEGKA